MVEAEEIKTDINLIRDIKSFYNVKNIFIFRAKAKIRYNNL